MQNNKIKFYLIHFIVGLITLACFLMAGPMSGGLPGSAGLEQRAAYIAAYSSIWTFGWCVWMWCALGLFAFCSILADELPSTWLSKLGLALVGFGIIPDLSAEVIYAFIMPKVAANPAGLETFKLLESIAMHLTGFLGNGLYNLGGLLLTVLLVGTRKLHGWLAAWGVLAWVLGLLLSVSVAAGSAGMMMLFTASSMVLSTLWMLAFAYTVIKK